MLILFNFSEMRNKRIHGGSMLDVASKVWHRAWRHSKAWDRYAFLRYSRAWALPASAES